MEYKSIDNDDSIFARVVSYIKTYIELKKLSTIEKLVLILSSVAVALLIGVVFLMVLFFMSVGLALYLGDILASYYLGFISVGLLYLLILIVLMLISKQYIKNPLTNYLIAKIFNK